MRSQTRRGSTPELTVPARSAHRRLLSYPESMARVKRVQAQAAPADFGYRMPAEWESHAATWLAWPHEKSDWPGKFAPIPWVYADIVRHLSQVERVRILVENKTMERAVCRILKSAGAYLSAVEFFHVPTNRGWIRDFGPIFVRSGKGEIGTTNWHFNAW